ncbi:MAG: ABC transporter ATP-binding protein [Marinibacterium sp.]
MIELIDLTKIYTTNGTRKVICENLNLVLPSRKSIALLGRNGAGKTTLLNMISGLTPQTSGEIVTTGSMSWPVGFTGSFHPDLTGAQNVKFVARVYGADTDETRDFVEDFADLGHHFHMPIRTYSSGMRGRLAFGLSMAFQFDTYLVDETTSTGDKAFKDKANALFRARMQHSGAVVVNHSMSLIRELCDVGVVLEAGQAVYFDNLEEAITRHEENMRRATNATLARMMNPEAG